MRAINIYTLSTVVDLLALAASLWLGFYIVTRSPRSRVSWLAALTLWSIASLFLHNAVAVNVPESDMLLWLRPVVVLGLPFWFHLTFLLLPDGVRWGKWTLSSSAGRFVIVLAYGVALIVVVGGVVPGGLSSDAKIGTAAYLSGRVTGSRYFLAVVFFVLWTCSSLYNLWQGRSHVRTGALRRQFTHLIVASVLAGLGIFYIMLGVWLRLDLLILPGDVALGAGVILLGYTVVRYNALIEVRAIERDFLYAALTIGVLTAFYYLAALLLYFGGHVSFLSLILVIVVAVSSHALYDGVRVALDRLFYREQYRQLRANLRALAQEAGAGQALSDQLGAILEALCQALEIGKGFVALRTETGFVVTAARAIGSEMPVVGRDALSGGETIRLPRSDAEPLKDMALLVPLFAGGDQVGALLLGSKTFGEAFDEGDLELVEDLADQMAAVIKTARLQEDNAQAINAMVADFRERERALQRRVGQMVAEREAQIQPVLPGVAEKEFVSLVEDGLRRLYDFSYLGEHALARLQVVNGRLQDEGDAFVTHVERGKALKEVLLQAVEKLRPEGAEPVRVPPREWHQFLILHDSYVLGEANRDIMSRLYISEGTFNRTRRRAVRGVAKVLQEMESEFVKRKT